MHGVHPAGELLAQEREREPGEVGPAAGAADDQVGHVARVGHLQQRLLADHGLVQQHVVEHAAERVVARLVLRRHLDRLADGDAEAARVVRRVGEDLSTRLGQAGGAAVHGRAERLHHRAPVGLAVVRRPHLPHLALEPVLRAGEGQGRAPLARARLGRQRPDAAARVVVGLRHRGVGLVRARGGDALVLVVDAGRRAQRPLEAVRPVQRRRPPEPVDVEHLVGDVDVGVTGDLLRDQLHREQRRQVVRSHRLHGARVQGRRRWRGQVGDDVVPARRELRLVEQELVLHGHGGPP